MKRLIFLALGSALCFAMGNATALADNGPHVKPATPNPVADGCAGCHRAHTAKAPKQLVQAQPALCYTCHGATGAGATTDVVDGQGYSLSDRTGAAGALRGGGFTYALIDSGHPTGQDGNHFPTGVIATLPTRAPVTSSHSVDGTSGTAWGNGAISSSANYGKAVSLVCGSCHDPHGNGNYRILKPIPDESGATAPGTAIPDALTTRIYTTTNYWQAGDTNAPGFIANVAQWCSSCHTRYLSNAVEGAGQDSGDAVYRYRHLSNDPSSDPPLAAPNCIQCHVAHGSNASMGTFSNGVTNPDGTAAVGDSRLLRIDNRGICQMCHNR